MNHLLCRCGAALAHLNALLGHYQAVHGGVPQAKNFSADGCDTSAMPTPKRGIPAQEELFTCVSECYNEDATQVPQLRLANSPHTVRFARLSRDLCRSETQRKGGLFCGR